MAPRRGATLALSRPSIDGNGEGCGSGGRDEEGPGGRDGMEDAGADVGGEGSGEEQHEPDGGGDPEGLHAEQPEQGPGCPRALEDPKRSPSAGPSSPMSCRTADRMYSSRCGRRATSGSRRGDGLVLRSSPRWALVAWVR